MLKILRKQFGNFLNPCTDKISWKCNAERDLEGQSSVFSQNASSMTTAITAMLWRREVFGCFQFHGAAPPLFNRRLGRGKEQCGCVRTWMNGFTRNVWGMGSLC